MGNFYIQKVKADGKTYTYRREYKRKGKKRTKTKILTVHRPGTQHISGVGTGVYKVNRKIGGNEALGKYNILSHSYLVSVGKGGKLKTYGWGNTKVKGGYGVYHIQAEEDIKAAKQAFRKRQAVRLAKGSDGSQQLDKSIKARSRQRKGKHVWTPMAQCKTEANRLWHMSKDPVKRNKRRRKRLWRRI